MGALMIVVGVVMLLTGVFGKRFNISNGDRVINFFIQGILLVVFGIIAAVSGL